MPRKEEGTDSTELATGHTSTFETCPLRHPHNIGLIYAYPKDNMILRTQVESPWAMSSHEAKKAIFQVGLDPPVKLMEIFSTQACSKFETSLSGLLNLKYRTLVMISSPQVKGITADLYQEGEQ